MNEVQMEQVVAGQILHASRKKYREVRRRVRAIVEDYGQRPLENFLRGLAHNFQFQTL